TYLVVILSRIPALSAARGLLTLPTIVKVADPNRSGQNFSLEAYLPSSSSLSSRTDELPTVGRYAQTTGEADDILELRPSSSWDSNWGFGPPCGSTAPGVPPLPDEPPPDQPPH